MSRLLGIITSIRSITKPYGGNRSVALEFEEMERVEIAESTGPGSFNAQFVVTYTQFHDIKVFAEMLRSTVESDEANTSANPDFDLELHWRGNMHERYHLWLGRKDESSRLQNAEHRHLLYRVPAHVTNRLINVLGVDE